MRLLSKLPKPAVFFLSVIASGFSFVQVFRNDPLLLKDFLHQRVGALDHRAINGGETIRDGSYFETINSYQRVRAGGMLYHNLKNVTHEWCDARPKLASKFLPALIVWPWVIYGLVKIILWIW
jgi:hypothetical protein